MKCHYEILEISKEAEDSEIRSAYRKLALKWHPDKNLDNPAFAKEQFQMVQQAYEVLSDKQERAWYDAHRDQILRGANSEFQDKSLDVFQYFTSTCFKGYGDNEDGFYGVYRKVFHQIAKEDIEFMDEKQEFCEIPGFGHSESDYENVKAFYDYWMSYSTKKSYSWLDPYDIREGKGDRRLLKIIEKENKKVRLKARKERNEEVKNLVAFVRKRDKRVQVFKKELEAKTLENRKKHEELSKQKRLERNKDHSSEKQADWLKFDNVKSELEEIEKSLVEAFGEELSQSDNEDEVENLYCVACNKIFKSPKAFENHELSKKHKDNAEKLKQSMLEDDFESNVAGDYKDLEDDRVDVGIIEEDSLTDEGEISETINNEEFYHTEKIEGSSDIQNDGLGRKSKKKSKNIPSAGTTEYISKDLDITKISDDDDFDFGISKNQKKNPRQKCKTKVNFVDDEICRDSKEGNNENIAAPVELKMKKDARKERKAHKKKVDSSELGEIDLSRCCVTCKNNFSSKNKLFDHLKKTGHGVYLPNAKQCSKKKQC